MSEIVGISLGNVCYSAEYGVQNGLRKTKAQGYNTCPFDLMVSNYKGIVDCINDDFLYFCDTEYLTFTNDPNDYLIFNKKYNFIFNHESPHHANLHSIQNWPEGPYHFTNNNCKNFIERYNRRINSFRQYLNDSNNYIIFIIQFKYDTNPNDDVDELRRALKIKYPNLKYEIRYI
jgi:hypothetical protein